MSCLCPILAAVLAATAAPEEFYPGEEHVVTGLVAATLGSNCILSSDADGTYLFSDNLSGVSTGDVIVADCIYSHHHHGNRTHKARRVRKIGRGTVPPPKDMPLHDLVAHGPYQKMVRVRGILDDISIDEIDPSHRIALVRSEGAFLPVPVSPTQNGAVFETLETLLHREIELTGVYIRDYPTARYFSGPIFMLCGPHPLRPIGTSLTDLFSAPPIPTGRIFTPEELAGAGLRTLTGTVTATWGENNLLLTTQVERGLAYHRVELPHGLALPRVGERIQILGQPETDTYHINFARARWRPAPGAAAPTPAAKPFDLDELEVKEHGVTRFNPDCYGRPFTICGTLASLPVAGQADSRLRIRAHGTDIAVDVSACPDVLRGLPLGATVEATGICLQEIDSWRAVAPRPRIRSSVLLLRRAEDLVLVRLPPWWTARRIAALAAILLAILLGVLVWNRTLNRLVIRRSRELVRAQSARNASELRIGERTRLAVELHDALSQNLAGVACQVASAAETVEADAAAAKTRLAVAQRMLKSCRTELRNVLADLRSRALEVPDFNDALRLVLKPLTPSCAFAIRFAVPRSHLLDTTAHALLAIVRELAGNAVRHGHATHVRIAAARDARGIRLAVQDDGTGFDPATAPGPAEGHFGLDGVRSRLRTLGGDISFERTTDGGTRAVIDLPS